MSTGEKLKSYSYILPEDTPGFINLLVYPAIYSEKASGSNELFAVSDKLHFFYEAVNPVVFEGLVHEIQYCMDSHLDLINQGKSSKSVAEIQENYNRKILHTLYSVPLAAVDLMLEESGVRSLDMLRGTPDFLNKMHAVMLHDVARFDQYLKTEGFLDSIYNHGEEGEAKARDIMNGENARTSPFAFIDVLKIREAVQYHNALEVPEGVIDPELCEFVRNADRIALSREWNANGQFQLIKVNPFLQSGPVSSLVFKKFMKGEQIKTGECVSKLDKLVNRVAWFFDVNSPAAIRLMRSEGHIDRAFGAMMELILGIEGIDEKFLLFQMDILKQMQYKLNGYLAQKEKVDNTEKPELIYRFANHHHS